MFNQYGAPIIKPADCSEEQMDMAHAAGWTTTVNLMNPEAGLIWIEEDSKGGACDPSTERYWTM